MSTSSTSVSPIGMGDSPCSTSPTITLASPFFFLDEFATAIIPLTWSIVHLIYIFLFYSQYKKLN